MGAPYANALKGNTSAQTVNSWRVTHLSLPISAILMLVVAILLPLLAVTAQVKWVIAWALIVSSYGFCIGMPLAALTGQRGLSSGGVGLGKLVYIGNIFGVFAAIVAAVVLLYAAFVSL